MCIFQAGIKKHYEKDKNGRGRMKDFIPVASLTKEINTLK